MAKKKPRRDRRQKPPSEPKRKKDQTNPNGLYRYFTTRDGKRRIDAYDYGYKAWPIGNNDRRNK